MSQPTLSATDVEDCARRLLQQASEQELTLAAAESCTGGLVSSLLTDVEGLSHAFERGFIVYTDEAKCEMLGIPRDLIEREGAVSRAAAIAMAGGALDRSQADIALAVTGFAGPAGPDDEIGLVHLACQRRGYRPAHREEHFGRAGRTAVRESASRILFAMAIDAMDETRGAAG